MRWSIIRPPNIKPRWRRDNIRNAFAVITTLNVISNTIIIYGDGTNRNFI